MSDKRKEVAAIVAETTLVAYDAGRMVAARMLRRVLNNEFGDDSESKLLCVARLIELLEAPSPPDAIDLALLSVKKT